MFEVFLDNVLHNLFKPLLLFFYAGFLIPLFHVKLEFPKAVYQGLTIYLLLSIGWKGGEELAGLEPHLYWQAAGFMVIGFVTNFCIGILAYNILRWTTKLRQIDAATVAGYYGSDSAGTFVTCAGVLEAAQIAFAPYMPVMLAVMEIPGCLVALYIIAHMRRRGMDAKGNMPGEPGYRHPWLTTLPESGSAEETSLPSAESIHADEMEAMLALQQIKLNDGGSPPKKGGPLISKETLHEVFMNPGIFLLFAGIAIGFISRCQGTKVTDIDDALFVKLFHGFLCVFLLEMGMTASEKLKDLKTAGWQFVAFALIAPNLFATMGMLIAHAYSMFLGQPFEVGTYVLFAVLCGAASYIAVPAVQRLAIPEASPTLPLAASLGVTFSYNVSIGIPVYIIIATLITKISPVVAVIPHAG